MHHSASAFLAFLVLAAVLPAAAVAAQAQSPAAAASNRAPPLTRASFITTMNGQYQKLDTNKDGVVTQPELRDWQVGLAAAAARATFSRIDTNRNGQLSADEYVQAEVGRSQTADTAAILKRLDGNGDRKITLVEYRALTLSNFDRLDTDKDGILNEAEQRAGGFVR